jgi:hypothetical protein
VCDTAPDVALIVATEVVAVCVLPLEPPQRTASTGKKPAGESNRGGLKLHDTPEQVKSFVSGHDFCGVNQSLRFCIRARLSRLVKTRVLYQGTTRELQRRQRRNETRTPFSVALFGIIDLHRRAAIAARRLCGKPGGWSLSHLFQSINILLRVDHLSRRRFTGTRRQYQTHLSGTTGKSLFESLDRLVYSTY